MEFSKCQELPTCNLLDRPMGRKCLAKLIGMGQDRMSRQASGAPDLRFGHREHRSQPGSFTVDAFLQVAYDSIAETLPDKYLATSYSNMLK